MIEPGTYPGSPDRPVRYDGHAGLSWLSASELGWLIAGLPHEGLFIEVGSASGVTAARIADARPNLSVVCVDTYVDSDDPRVAEAEPGRLTNWKANRRPNMHLWLGSFAAIAGLISRRSAVAILIDADHEEAAVARDLLIAATILDPIDGTLYCHDCDEPGWPGVSRAVDAFCTSKSSGFECIGQHWTLRALRRGG